MTFRCIAFPLDSLGQVARSLGGSPQKLRAQQHTWVHEGAIGRDQVKNHFVPRDLPSRTLCGGAKTKV